MFSKREMLFGVPTLIASAMLCTKEARAINSKSFRRIAATVVQGVNFVTNPAQQVATAARLLTPVVRRISPDAERATEMVRKLAEANSTVEARLRIAAGITLPQAAPLFANVGFKDDVAITTSIQAQRPLNLRSSVEDELVAYPAEYVQNNSEFLGDYVRRYPSEVVSKTFLIRAGEVSADVVHSAAVAGPRGYYPSVLSINDMFTLISVFRV